MTALRMSRPALVLVLFVVSWLALLAGSAAADDMPPPSGNPAPPAQNACPAGGCVNTYDGGAATPKKGTHSKQGCDPSACGQHDPAAPQGCDPSACGQHDPAAPQGCDPSACGQHDPAAPQGCDPSACGQHGDPGPPQVVIVPGNPPAQRPGPRANPPAPPAAAGDPVPPAAAPQAPGVDFVPGEANPVPVIEQSASSRGAGAAVPDATTPAGSDTAETPTTQFRVRLRSGVTVKILAVYVTRMSVDVQNFAGREYGKIRTMTYWGAGATIGAGLSVTRLSDWEDYNTVRPVSTSDFGGGAYRGELPGATIGTWSPGGSVGSNLGPPNNDSVVMPNDSVGLGVSLGAWGYGGYR
jgi:hypothetical protein